MDILYAVFTRIVVLPLVAYFEYGLLQQLLDDSLAGIGLSAPSLPGLLGSSALAFLAGFVILDLTDYWQHRFSHRIGWWYGVHSVHHAEEQMTFWSDERTHVLEEAITYVWLIIVGLLIGIPAIQFPFMILGLRLIASVSHANTSVSYSWLGERLFVSPRFHRVHHALRYGSNRNMGTALPWWDMLWGTADFTSQPVETGDLSAEAVLASGGWFAQQRAGLRRMVTIARRRRQRRRRRSQHAAQ